MVEIINPFNACKQSRLPSFHVNRFKQLSIIEFEVETYFSPAARSTREVINEVSAGVDPYHVSFSCGTSLITTYSWETLQDPPCFYGHPPSLCSFFSLLIIRTITFINVWFDWVIDMGRYGTFLFVTLHLVWICLTFLSVLDVPINTDWYLTSDVN